jgi:hypothetical protein
MGRTPHQGESRVSIRWIVFVAGIAGLLGAQGCAAVGLTLLGVGAGVTTGTGVAYTLDSVAYKTFTVSEAGLHAATLKTLQRMDIPVTNIEPKEEATGETGRKLVASAGDRAIEIELDRLTSKTSRMRVNVKQGRFFKDRATATEIILQTERTLEEEPALARIQDAATASKPKPN